MIPEGEAVHYLADARPTLPNDQKRVRAVLFSVLTAAAGRGDTFLSLDEAFRRVGRRFPQNRQCNPDREAVLEDLSFFERILSFRDDGYPRLALKDLKSFEEEVSE